MKNLFKISALVIMAMFMVNCSNDDAPASNAGNVPSNGWRIGTTNYTTSVVQRIAMGDIVNSISAIDVTGGESNLNNVILIFNETTGIAAGSYKIVTGLDGTLPAADEVMFQAGTKYSNATGVSGTTYYAVPNQTVNATVTITNGKAKIVIPQININTFPVDANSVTTTFAGTIVE